MKAIGLVLVRNIIQRPDNGLCSIACDIEDGLEHRQKHQQPLRHPEAHAAPAEPECRHQKQQKPRKGLLFLVQRFFKHLQERSI